MVKKKKKIELYCSVSKWHYSNYFFTINSPIIATTNNITPSHSPVLVERAGINDASINPIPNPDKLCSKACGFKHSFMFGIFTPPLFFCLLFISIQLQSPWLQ